MSTWQTRREVTPAQQVTRVTEFNDSSLEILIALWRLVAMLAMLACPVATVAAAFGVPHAGPVAMVALFFALMFGWAGFWQFGNSTWRKPRLSNGGPVVREWADDDVNY